MPRYCVKCAADQLGLGLTKIDPLLMKIRAKKPFSRFRSY